LPPSTHHIKKQPVPFELKTMKRSKPVHKLSLTIILVIFLTTLVACSLPSQIFEQPQPQATDVQPPDPTLQPASTDLPSDTTAGPPVEEQLLEPIDEPPTSEPTATIPTSPAVTTAPTEAFSQSQPVCGSVPVMHVLMLGIDENEQADAIRLFRIDFVTEKVTVLSIPRDFYIDISDMAMHGIRKGRINATYGYGEFFNGDGGGVVSLATNIESNYGVTFDRYLVIHLKEIAKYIDIVGGVDIVLEQTVTDGYVTFNKGPHHLDGETAVYFMRMRLADSDFFRISRQSQLVTALFEKVMRERNILQIMKLGFNLLADKAIQTDFGIKDVYTYVCLASRLKSENLQFIGIPWSMFHGAFTTTGANVQIPHAEVPAFIRSVMDGTYEP